VLASASPQRRRLLEQLGIAFRVSPAGVAELDRGEPASVARENARRKAQAVPGELVLGVDTLVAVDELLLGKPADADEARRSLRRLSGRWHEVVSGLAVVRADAAAVVAHETTRVLFRDVSPALEDWYVAGGEWRGRAGGYAVQERGAALVRRVEGDYTNVVGLPVGLLLELVPELLPGPGEGPHLQPFRA